MPRSAALTFVTIMAVALTACGESQSATGLDEGGATLAPGELRSLVTSLERSFAAAGSTTSTEVVTCPLGGRLRVTPVRNNTTPSGIEVAVSVVPEGCRGAGDDGRVWTLDGQPSLDLEVAAQTTSADDLDVRIVYRGRLRVASEARVVTCAFDLTTTSRTRLTQPLSLTTRFVGAACGGRVDETMTMAF